MFTASHDYEKHLSDTRARLEDLLAPVYPTLPIDLRPSRLDDGFRGQARFSVNKSGDRLSVTGVEPVVGRASWESTLWILPGFAQRLAETIIQRVCSSYFRYPVRGFDLRLGYGTERAHLVLAVDRGDTLPFDSWAEDLLRDVPAVAGVSIPSQRLTVGEALIRHRLVGRDVLGHPLAFFQTNYWLTEPLLRHVASAVSRDPVASVLDLYCGVGVHSLLAGGDNIETTGVDADQNAIAVARQNAVQAGRVANYERSSIEAYLASGSQTHRDVVIVNPPRSGCGSGVVDGVAALTPHRVCLVCCSAEAHVQDLQRFRELGYEAREYIAFDMFPFTQFVENVTMLYPR